MRTVVLGAGLHGIDCDDKDIATAYPLTSEEARSGQVDALNHLLSRQIAGDITMVSGLFAFKDSTPIRYRRVFRNSALGTGVPLSPTHAPTLMANDSVLNNLLIRWKHEGKGDAIVCYSKRNSTRSANIREMYPHREGDEFFFYNGRYGTGELWNDVRNSRRQRGNISEAVFKKYTEHVKIGGPIDNTNFRDCIVYDHPDEGEIPRAYRVFVWKDGDTIHDDTYTDGYTANFRMSNLRHRYIEYRPDKELGSWGCY